MNHDLFAEFYQHLSEEEWAMMFDDFYRCLRREARELVEIIELSVCTGQFDNVSGHTAALLRFRSLDLTFLSRFEQLAGQDGFTEAAHTTQIRLCELSARIFLIRERYLDDSQAASCLSGMQAQLAELTLKPWDATTIMATLKTLHANAAHFVLEMRMRPHLDARFAADELTSLRGEPSWYVRLFANR